MANVDNSITSFSVLSSTATTLYARWTIVTNTSDSIEGFTFEFRSDTNESFEYKLALESFLDRVVQNDVFENNFMDIPNSQPYTVTTMLVTNTNAFTSVFSIGECK